MADFTAALALVLRHEGGYVNDPADPGGETNLGVTRRAYERFLGRAVASAEMRALTPATVAPFYRAAFWEPHRLDEVADQELAELILDHAVNTGENDEGRAGTDAARLLQEALNWVSRRSPEPPLAVDGLPGAVTLARVAATLATSGALRDALVERYRALRLRHYEEVRARLTARQPVNRDAHYRFFHSWIWRTLP